MARKSNLHLALLDLRDGINSRHIWRMLGWQDMQHRYKRSLIGPFWVPITTGIMVAAMGPLYGKLFNQPLGSYFIYFTAGFVIWQLISQLVSDSCHTFISAEGFIKQIRLPYTVYVLRMIWKNLIAFLHNAIVIVVVLLIFQPSVGIGVLTVPLGLAMLLLNSLWLGILLGLVTARFRDIAQIVANVLQVAFFLTPIMWHSDMLGRHKWAAELNPIYHFIEIIRGPLLGEPVNVRSWAVVCTMAVAGFLVVMPFFVRYRSRIAYWV